MNSSAYSESLRIVPNHLIETFKTYSVRGSEL